MVINKEDAGFQRKWDLAVKECEVILIDTLIKHLDAFIQKINPNIREMAKTTWLSIKKIDNDRASQALETALKESEETRKKKAESRKRRREENQKQTTQRDKKRTNDFRNKYNQYDYSDCNIALM